MNKFFMKPLWIWLFVFLMPGNDGLFSSSKCSDRLQNDRIISDCRRRGLINTVDIHLDSLTRVLDLSHNEFQRLYEDQFLNERLTRIEELILHDNQINMIDSEAFNGLTQLHYLDLSKNRISTWSIGYMPPLQTLNLSNNALKTDVIIYSDTLEVLDISNCHLTTLPIRHYSNLPRLKHLNLSYNSIDKLPLTTLKHTSLRTIQFVKNPIACTGEIDKLIKWFDVRQIQYSRICFYQQQSSPDLRVDPDRDADTPIYQRPQNLPVEVLREYQADGAVIPTHNECLTQLSSMRNEHRFFAIITLAVHVIILIVVIVFFGVFLSYRFHDAKKLAVREISEQEEETDNQEIPPPPYRSRSYVPGFNI